jgi:hypothetical protein
MHRHPIRTGPIRTGPIRTGPILTGPILTGPIRAGLALAVAAGLILSGCGGGDDTNDAKGDDTSSTTVPDVVQGSVASYDLAVGPPSRFMVGMFNEAKGPIGFGTAALSFFFLGEKDASGTPQPGPTATATYLPIPGSQAPADTSKPSYLPADQRGVYAAEVAFDRPGFWGVAAVVDLEGRKEAKTAFQVLPEHAVPFVGDPAPKSQNLTVTTPGAPPEAIDSRASASTPVPDADLHQTTVAEALSQKWPVLLVISTPTYCVSRFCGPITDEVADLAKTYGDRARFIHIEVFKDYKATKLADRLNAAAAEWIGSDENVREPWVFMIGADGKISARFDNIASRGELEPLLQKLPKKA